MAAGDSGNIDITLLEQEAAQLLVESGHCAQTTFSVLNDYFELDGANTLKALTPMPGIALRGEVCGALTGAMMALGLVFGRDQLNDLAGFQRSLPPARAFCRLFESQHGGIQCGDILEKALGRRFDLASTVDFVEYLNCGGHEKCSAIVQSAVRLAAEQIIRGREIESDDPGVMLTA
jgi:C_GCAxxG_C_C family probable redox protein